MTRDGGWAERVAIDHRIIAKIPDVVWFVDAPMRQFYEAYRGKQKVSAPLRQLPWTHHMIILGQAKPPEAQEFYLLAAIKGRWSSRELERQIATGAALRSASSAKKVSPAVALTHPTAVEEFKNAYSLEFLSMQDGHSEADLHSALLRNLGRRSATRTSRSTLSPSTARFSASSPSS